MKRKFATLKKTLALILLVFMLASTFTTALGSLTVSATEADTSEKVVLLASPAIKATAGEPVDLSSYVIQFSQGKNVKGSEVTFTSSALTVIDKKVTPTQKGVFEINALFESLDFMIVRENTEGMYIAKEEEYTEEGAIARRIITRNAERRIIDYAFQYAKSNNRSKVTGVHKANVLKVTDGLFKEIFYEVAKDYEGEIEAEDFYVDATAMYLITRPESFEVIVTTNLFGDILSDEGAGLVGGLGMIPSGNIGEEGALFEPVHGSAPDIAGQGIANPMAMLLSACMMLNYLKEYEAEERLNDAILAVLNEGKVLTPDLGGNASTIEVAEAIINALN